MGLVMEFARPRFPCPSGRGLTVARAIFRHNIAQGRGCRSRSAFPVCEACRPLGGGATRNHGRTLDVALLGLIHARRPSLREGSPRGLQASHQSFEVAPAALPSLMFDERRCRTWFLGVAVPARLLAGALEGNWIPLQEYDSTHRDGGPTPCHPSPPLRASIVPSAKNSRSCSEDEDAGPGFLGWQGRPLLRTDRWRGIIFPSKSTIPRLSMGAPLGATHSLHSASLRARIVPSAKNSRSCSVAEYAGLSSRIASCPQLHL